MGEVNEKDLEQVTGGAEFDDMQKKWYQQNCLNCAKVVASCSPTKIYGQVVIAIAKAQRGEEYACPYKS